MQEKHRFMVHALARRYRTDAADAFIAEMRARIDELRATLTDGERTAATLVTRPEPMLCQYSFYLVLLRNSQSYRRVIVQPRSLLPHFPFLLLRFPIDRRRAEALRADLTRSLNLRTASRRSKRCSTTM